MAAAPPTQSGSAPLELLLPTDRDGASLRRLRRGYFNVLLRRLSAVDPASLQPALRRPFTEAMHHLQRALVAAPDTVESILCHPTLGTLVNCLEAAAPGSPRQSALLAELLPLLALELAWAKLLATPLVWPARALALWSAPHNVKLDLAPEVEQVAFESGRMALRSARERLELNLDEPSALARLVHPLARGSAPFPRLAAGPALALFDNNPLRMLEEHPEKHGNALDLGGKSPDVWRAALDESLALVAAHLPGLAAEMRLGLAQIVPVGWDSERHLSASYREAVGTVYMTLHPQVMTMAEAVIHEFQHNKLYTLMNQDPVLENGFSEFARSPVRPDPRPIFGILLAVHAFVPVAALYHALQQAGHPIAAQPCFEERFGVVVAKNEEGMEVLRRLARPTSAGKDLLAEIEALHARHLTLPLPRPSAPVEHVG